MSYTNYVVSSLPNYVKNNNEVIAKQLAFGAPTIKRITPQLGVKHSAYINLFTTDVPFQSGSACGFTSSGTATFTQRTIVTAMLKKEIEICPDNLLGKWGEYEVRVPADQRDYLPFEAYVVASMIDQTNAQLDKAIWRGDATNGTGDLAFFDGFLTILAGEQTAVTKSIAAGWTAWGAMKEIIGVIPAVVMEKGAKVFVSPEFFTQLSLELVEKNLYHFEPTGDLDSIIFPGTNIEVYKTAGLASTKKIVVSYAENMFYGTDTEDAERRVKVVYDEKADTFAVKFHWNSGVQVAFPDHCVLATLA